MNSMDQDVSGDQKPLSETFNQEEKKKKVDAFIVPGFKFPESNSCKGLKGHFPTIRDDGSEFEKLVTACLAITQFAGHGSSSEGDEKDTVHSSALFHDKSYASTMSEAFASLITCCKEHKDRRCRSLACRTLALAARSAYARIRHSPLLFSTRDATVNQVEDEVASEIPVALATVALEDADDGVSSSAAEALGILTLSTAPSAATIVDDDLLRELEAIAFCRRSPFAPTLRSVVDEDPSIPQLELQSRIYQHVMAPRLLQFVSRIVHYDSAKHYRITLPFLTASLIYQVYTAPSIEFDMDRSTYAKRWLDLDAVGLVNDVVTGLLLPAMQSSFDGDLAHTAALCALRLANACPHASWVLEVCRWSVVVLKEEISATVSLEVRMGTIAALIVALRAIPLPERAPTLEGMVTEIAALPYTAPVPHGICSAGVMITYDNVTSFRRPARIALFTELALSLFMDGPLGDTSSTVKRSLYLKRFLSSGPVVNICKETEKKTVVRMRDELLLVFTSIAWEVGRRFRVSPDGSVMVANASSPEVNEWTQLAFTTLSIFSPCTRWGQKSAYLEEDLSLLIAGQSNYIRLFQEFLHFVGLVHPLSSVTFKLTPNACPPHLLWDQMTESAHFLGKFDVVSGCSNAMLQDIAALVDDFVEKELRQGTPSHHMRLFLLTLGTDQWVQGRYVAIRKQIENTKGASSDPSQLTLNVTSVKDLLVALSPRRLLTKLMEYRATQADAQGTKKKDPIKRLATETVRVSVACIENMALTASDWRRRFGSTPDSQSIVNMAIASLGGKLTNEPLDEFLVPIMKPICDNGIERIQSFYKSDKTGGDGGQAFPVSPLVTQPMKYKIKPMVSALKPSPPDRSEYISGYMMQLSRQIIASRVEMSLFAAPTADAFLSYARPRNWLRISIPPLPESRDARRKGLLSRTLASFGNSVSSSFGGSDASALVVGHALRRCPRYDNEDEFRVLVVMQVYNNTAVEIEKGIQLELGVTRREYETSMDQVSMEFLTALGGDLEEFEEDKPMVAATSLHKQPLSAGDKLTWEVELEHLPVTGNVTIYPTVVFNGISQETDSSKMSGADMVRTESGSTTSDGTRGNRSGEGDFQVDTGEAGKNATDFTDDHTPFENVSFAGETTQLSPMLGLQPCPLVFYRDAWGDLDTFRFLWFRMPEMVPPLNIEPMEKNGLRVLDDEVTRHAAAASSLLFEGEAIPGGIAVKLWAFMSLQGHRVLCIQSETETGARSLYLRADNKALLYSLVSSKTARTTVVATLVPGMRPMG